MKALIRRKKILLAILIYTCFPSMVFSQIQGSVNDVNNIAVPFANVLLLNVKDSSLVSGVLATEEGTYQISNYNPGVYLLGISMMGYKPAYSAPFTIKSSNEHLHNEPLIVEEDSHQLQDVNLVAKKPVYELQIDRMVINVANSITSTGNTALEVLEKSPGVTVDRQNNTISMSAKGGVMVMINGRQNRMPIEVAVQMLASMSSDNVQKIELITTPPSKYDAEGDAGIINIVLKKNDAFVTNGSFVLGAGLGVREKLDGSLNLNHHERKMNYFGS